MSVVKQQNRLPGEVVCASGLEEERRSPLAHAVQVQMASCTGHIRTYLDQVQRGTTNWPTARASTASCLGLRDDFIRQTSPATSYIRLSLDRMADVANGSKQLQASAAVLAHYSNSASYFVLRMVCKHKRPARLARNEALPLHRTVVCGSTQTTIKGPNRRPSSSSSAFATRSSQRCSARFVL